MSKPKQRTAEFKFNLILEVLKGDKSIVQLASENQMHPKQIQRWRDQLLQEGANVFTHKTALKHSDPDKEELLHIINQLSADIEYLKKKLKRNG
jgi:transposase